jgi:hypothetical protein
MENNNLLILIIKTSQLQRKLKGSIKTKSKIKYLHVQTFFT